MGGGDLSGRRRRSAGRRYRRRALLRHVFGQRHRLGMRLCVRARQKNRRGASARGKVELHDQLFLPRERAGEWIGCAPTIFPFARPQTITNSAARRICGIAHRGVFPGAEGFFLSRMRGETSAGTRICDK